MIESVFVLYSADKLTQLSSRIQDCLKKLSNEQIWTRSSDNENAVGNLALFRSAQKRKAIIGETFDIQLRGATGQTLPGRLVVLNRLTLGKMTLVNVPVVMAAVHTFDYWGLTREPAILIGSDVLQKFETVALDFKRREVRFKIAGRG